MFNTVIEKVKQLRIKGIGSNRTSLHKVQLLFYYSHLTLHFMIIIYSMIRLIESNKWRSGGINRLPVRALWSDLYLPIIWKLGGFLSKESMLPSYKHSFRPLLFNSVIKHDSNIRKCVPKKKDELFKTLTVSWQISEGNHVPLGNHHKSQNKMFL